LAKVFESKKYNQKIVIPTTHLRIGNHYIEINSGPNKFREQLQIIR